MVHVSNFRTYPHFSGSPINLLPWLSRQDQTFSALVSSIIPRQVRNIFPAFYCVGEQISNPCNVFLLIISWWMLHSIVSLDLCLRKHSQPVWLWTIFRELSLQTMSTWSCSRWDYLTNQGPGHAPLTNHNAGDVWAQGHGALHLRDQRQGVAVPLPPAAGPIRCRGGCRSADGAIPGLPRHHLSQGVT